MHAHSRLTTLIAPLAFLAIICLSESARSEDGPKSRKAPKTEYIRFEPSNGTAKASREFDAKVKTVFIAAPRPYYPYEARRSRITGSGLLRIYVDETGKVAQVKILKSTGTRSLDDAGLNAFRQWRAKPGNRRVVDMPLVFVLSDSQNDPGDTGTGNDGLGIMKSRDR
jgi:TonB family protein